MRKVPARFPKIHAPYTRSNDDSGNYTVNEEIKDGYGWVFDRAEDVEAVEKLHGTNVAVEIDVNGDVIDASTRVGDRSMNEINPYNESSHHDIVRGIQNSIRRGYMEVCEEGWNFGELVGPSYHENPYDLDEHLFIPFEWLRDKCEYRSYGKYSTEFDDISNWLENEIFSLFYSRMHGTDLDESSVSEGVFVEGLVFIHPDFEGVIRTSDLNSTDSDQYGSVATNVAKLRRDMFSWY